MCGGDGEWRKVNGALYSTMHMDAYAAWNRCIEFSLPGRGGDRKSICDQFLVKSVQGLAKCVFGQESMESMALKPKTGTTIHCGLTIIMVKFCLTPLLRESLFTTQS